MRFHYISNISNTWYMVQDLVFFMFAVWFLQYLIDFYIVIIILLLFDGKKGVQPES